MLSRLHLRNFKSWREAELDFRPITGLFGENSSGKSSLAQFLLLLKQTRESSDRAAALDLNGRFIDLGVAADVIHAHDESLPLEFELDFKLDSALKIADPASHKRATIVESNRFGIHAEAVIGSGKFQGSGLEYRVGSDYFTLRKSDSDIRKFDLIAKTTGYEFSFIRNPGRVWGLSGPVKTYRFPDAARTYFQNSSFLSDLEATFEGCLDKIFYLGPLRNHPQRDYLWARSRPDDVGTRGERTVDAIIALASARQTQNLRRGGRRQPVSSIIAHWLRELSLIDDFIIVEIAPGSNRWQVKIRTRAGGSEVMLTDVGFGVSQVLPVITILHYVPEGSTVLIEQPEIHLHPLAQACLADVIIHAALHRKVQVVFESHSEHLLMRLQRRIAEERLRSDDVALYFCHARRSTSTIEPLRVDLLGNIENWPKGFMGDAFGETAAAELARIERMQQPDR